MVLMAGPVVPLPTMPLISTVAPGAETRSAVPSIAVALIVPVAVWTSDAFAPKATPTPDLPLLVMLPLCRTEPPEPTFTLVAELKRFVMELPCCVSSRPLSNTVTLSKVGGSDAPAKGSM